MKEQTSLTIYIACGVIILMLIFAWSFIATVENHLTDLSGQNNQMLRNLTHSLIKTGNATNQARGIAEIHTNNQLLHELLNGTK